MALAAAQVLACRPDSQEGASTSHDGSGERTRSVRLELVLNEIKASKSYQNPTPQDDEGRGIYPSDGRDGRSETIYPPFVLAPRRQTDYLVRQLYSLLPLEIQRSTAFVIPDRLIQNPEAFLPYLQSRSQVLIIGNFGGIGEFEKDEHTFVERHERELWMADASIRLVQASGATIKQVRYTMGDSFSKYSAVVRNRLEKQLFKIALRNGVKEVTLPVTWGADEAVPLAFAAQLPPLGVRVTYTTETSRHFYDGGKLSREVLESKMSEAQLVLEKDKPDFEVLVLTNELNNDDKVPRQNFQDKLNRKFLGEIQSLEPQRRQKVAIIDARMFNGALDRVTALRTCDFLAFGSWGTMANKSGTTIATAKILYYARRPAAQRQLLLEAIAHDVFANGYIDGREKFSPLLNEEGVKYNHFEGYNTEDQVTKVFDVVETFVNNAMKVNFTDQKCMQGRRLRVTPQLWRTFESEIHLLPFQAGEIPVVGVFRKDYPASRFDPTFNSPELKSLPLESIIKGQ